MFGKVKDTAFRRRTAELIKLADRPLFLRKTGRLALLMGTVLLVIALGQAFRTDHDVLVTELITISPMLLLLTVGLLLMAVGGMHVFRQTRPAGMIYLASSTRDALARMERLGRAAYPIRPVALLEERVEDSGADLVGDNSLRVRAGAELHWKSVVADVCDFAGVILIDPGEFGAPVRWEAQHLAKNSFGWKTVLIGFDSATKSEETRVLMAKLLADGAWVAESFDEVEQFIRFLVMKAAVFPEERTQHISSLHEVFKRHGGSFSPASL